MAASATFALKSGEWFRRVRFVIFAPDSHAQPCALSGRDSTHRTDRNCGATSQMFDWDGDQARVKPWLREGITWQLGDTSSPELIHVLGPQDIVVSNNFLCHMEPLVAENCLRNIAGVVDRGGYLF